MAHSAGPRCTVHTTAQYLLANPHPLEGEDPVMLRAELFRLDETGERSETVMVVAGETDVEMSPAEADIFIAQAQAFVDTLRVLRRQMV